MKREYFAYYIKSSEVSGVVRSWKECENLVQGQSGSVYKKFSTHKAALEFLLSLVGEKEEKSSSPLWKDALYFDSGTGRGEGVEVSVTNSKKESQLHHLLSEGIFSRPLTERGTYILPLEEGYTNNFGELLGLYCALKLASLLKISRIAGDSKLVLEYWSRGRWNASKLPERTIELASLVTRERKRFEASHGAVLFIPGGENPADLGFHR